LARDDYFNSILRQQQQLAQALRTMGAFDKALQQQLAQTLRGMGTVDKALQQAAQVIQANHIWQDIVSPSSILLHLNLLQRMKPFQMLLQDAMHAHTAYIAAWSKQFDASSALLKNFTFFTRQIAAWAPPNLRGLKKALRAQLLAAFERADLWPVPSMTKEFMYTIAQSAENSRRQTIMLLVWNYYARHDQARLKDAVSTWWDDPEYAARRPIIEQALEAHRLKLYAVSIPALLAQVEGIANDFVHRNALMTVDGKMLKLGKSGQVVQRTLEVTGCVDNVDVDSMDIIQWVMAEAVILYVENVSYENVDFASRYAELRKQRELNRHGTLHGIQINYYSAMNSLRCFLLLDALYGLRRYAAEIEAKRAGRSISSV